MSYDRTSHPFFKLYDFLKKVEQAYDQKNPKDDTGKFGSMVTSLSPESKKPILPGAAPDLPGLPDSIDDDGR